VPLVLAAAPDHPLADAPHVVADDLRGEKLLVNVPECSFWMAGERLLGSAVERVTAGSVTVMASWAERGLGIALLPEFAVRDRLAAGTLVPLALTMPGLTLRLVWRSDREALPGMREVLYAASA
jgi:DNA-binding transcriptional LysR family regulator